MNSFLAKRTLKKKVDQILEDPKEKEKSFDAVDAYESVENKIKGVKDWFIHKFQRVECQVAWCHESPEKTSCYCKTHKCHECDERRARNKFNCDVHSP